MPIGSILSNFPEVEIETADNKKYRVKLNLITKIAIKIFGIPHIGFRNRARRIFNFLSEINSDKLKILDAGCGYGIYSLSLSEKGNEIYSIDLEEKRIKHLNKLKKYDAKFSKIKSFVGSINNLPFASNYFDVVLCSEVIEHIKDDKLAFSELTRVIRKGGNLILTVPTVSKSNKINYKKFEHERPGYSVQDIKSLAEKNKMKIVKFSFYERAFGSFAFKIHNKFSNKIIVSLLFYPLYLFSFLDNLFKIGEPNGQVVLLEKAR